MESFLPLIELCDNYKANQALEPLVPFYVNSADGSGKEIAIGWIRSLVIPVLRDTALSVFTLSDSGLRFRPELDSADKRSSALETLCQGWRTTGLFSEIIGGRLWRNERYPVYYNPFRRHSAGDDIAFSLERTCCAIFGLVTYGCHMTMMLEGERKIWVPKRARTKQTWPGYLDNTVAGGIPSGIGSTDALLKECMEEASIPEEFVRSFVKPAGCVSYFFQTPKGWLQPEVEYVYDLIVPPGVKSPELHPLDGEVESFELCSIEEVIERMKQKLFKPNCALVLVDFLIRHGYISPESEPNYIEIVTRLHGRWGL
ncbi:hypothetical protein BS47DRAFT_1315755 [Hydnum rufescens UP504]|uniref:Nudix hydrolase domain-containing protein n=1 Tax=Hydnum rufescens UP504 TaxID=1448309 RepID=A0A9P6DVZ7_9AGAM|nr:hypothetical protein BS47DRAFT_1315755 [Hydnum rufescens UP504]